MKKMVQLEIKIKKHGSNSNGQGLNRSTKSRLLTLFTDQNENHVSNYALRNHSSNILPPQELNNLHFQPPQAIIAQIKFRENVAKIGSEKTDDAFIDSGATQNFFHSLSYFI